MRAWTWRDDLAWRVSLGWAYGPWGVYLGAIVVAIAGRIRTMNRHLSVKGHAWIEDQLASPGTDHLVDMGDGWVPIAGAIRDGDKVVTRCGLTLWADRVKTFQERGVDAQTGGGFDVGDEPQHVNRPCKACLDAVFQQTPIPNGSEDDGPTER